MFQRVEANFWGSPFGLLRTMKHQFSLRVFHVLFFKTSILLEDFQVFGLQSPLAVSGPPWEPFGSPWALHLPICMCWVCIPLVFHSHFCHSQSVRSAPKCPCSGFLVRNPPQMPRMSSGTLLHTTNGLYDSLGAWMGCGLVCNLGRPHSRM